MKTSVQLNSLPKITPRLFTQKECRTVEGVFASVTGNHYLITTKYDDIYQTLFVDNNIAQPLAEKSIYKDYKYRKYDGEITIKFTN